MTADDARAVILKAVDDYDDGRITRSDLVEVLDRTVEDLADSSFQAGVDVSDEDVEFEAEMELDDDDEVEDEEEPE